MHQTKTKKDKLVMWDKDSHHHMEVKDRDDHHGPIPVVPEMNPAIVIAPMLLLIMALTWRRHVLAKGS